MTIYSGFSYWKWWFSIVMLVYQRVFSVLKSYDSPARYFKLPKAITDLIMWGRIIWYIYIIIYNIILYYIILYNIIYIYYIYNISTYNFNHVHCPWTSHHFVPVKSPIFGEITSVTWLWGNMKDLQGILPQATWSWARQQGQLGCQNFRYLESQRGIHWKLWLMIIYNNVYIYYIYMYGV